jgi:hypothetical protein
MSNFASISLAPLNPRSISMFNRKAFLSCVLAGLFACVAANASAQATITNQPVFLTFNNNFVVPGTTLPAGEYEFRLNNTRGGDREIIEIYNRATGKHVTTVMAIGTTMSNLQPVPEKPAVRFYEGAANTPSAVRSWWYPGIRGGHEFIYSRAQAQQFAKYNSEGVLTTEGSVETGKITRMTESSESAVVAEANPAAAPTPAQTMVDQRTVVSDGSLNARQTPAPVMAQADARPARAALPKTAGTRPVLALAGIAALIAGLAVGLRRRVA